MIALSRESVDAALLAVEDPEIPGLSIVDLGIVRDSKIEGTSVTVMITPTYSGCPAYEVIQQGVVDAISALGAEQVLIEIRHAPPWTTDWITEKGKEVLRQSGIAAPQESALVSIGDHRDTEIPCPRCNSVQTELRSEFGATACKALCYCNACEEPFEYFKPF